jgi:hypothetical protein
MIHKFRARAPLGADRLPGRVRRIGVEPDETTIFDRCHRAAAGDAEATITVDALRASAIGHAIELASV